MGTWVAVGNSGKQTYSTNGGVTWSATADILGGSVVRSAAYGNGTWVAVGDAGKRTYSTNGGVTWSATANILDSQIILSVAYRNGIWVAVGAAGLRTYSTDGGVTWTATLDILDSQSIYSVAYSSDRYLGYGVSGRGGQGGVIGYGDRFSYGVVATAGDSGSPMRSPFRIVPSAQPLIGEIGDLYVSFAGILYVCTASGQPGTWTIVGSQS